MDKNQIFEQLTQIIQEYYRKELSGSFLEYHDPDSLKEILSLDKKETDGDWGVIFEWIEKYLKYSVKTNHPDFINRMWVGANLPSVLGEIIVAISNTSACTYESAPVSTLIEKYMIQKMLDITGFKQGEGQMTTGSSNANMIAMLAARNRVNKNIKTGGLFDAKQLFAFVSADAHYSLDKAANILGIGTDHLIKVPVNSHGQMDVNALNDMLIEVQANGAVPFFVAATCGTTVRGGFDPLQDLLELREKYGFWLHTDGAWGGAVVFHPELRKQFLQGLETVDSFCMDFHKMLGTSLMCNMLLLNHSERGGKPSTLCSVCSAGDESYIFRANGEDESFDPGTSSLQCGRRVDSLKLFLDWKFYGQRGFAARVEKNLSLAKYAESVVNQTAELEMVVPRESFNICFRYITLKNNLSNDFNNKLRTVLYHQGITLVGLAFVASTQVLRLLITNPAMTEEDVESFFKKVVVAAKELSKKEQ